MFLPDRYIKGECPKCGAKDQYGDSCEVCGSVYSPTDLSNPYSTLSGAAPVLRQSEHYFFRLSDPRCVEFLRGLDRRAAGCSPKCGEQGARVARRGDQGLGDWDISRDAPYFGIPIPDAPGKYFYVWLDAPIGYLASLKNHCDKGQAAAQTARLRRVRSPTRPSSRSTSSARTSSTSTRCSGRRCCSSRAARCPTTCTCTASSP